MIVVNSIRRFIAPALAVLLLGASAATAAPLKFEIDTVHSSVEFKVRHLVARSGGRFRDFSGAVTMDPKSPAEGSVVFSIKTASIDTANENRDNHLRSADFFDAEKFPEITFKSTRITAKGGDLFEVTGILNMHGVAQPAILQVRMAGPSANPFIPGAQSAGFSITTKVNRKDFGIVWNKAVDNGGTVLGDDVDVTIELEAIAKPEKPAEMPPEKPAEKPAKKG